MEFESYASNQIYKYAKSYDIKATAISYVDNLILLEHKGKKELIKQTATHFTNLIQGRICDNKILTTQYLKRNWIDNVPNNIVIKDFEEIKKYKINYPVVVKPLKWHWWKGISVWVRTKKDLESAYKIAKKVYFRVLVEEYIEGDDYRFLVIDKNVRICKRMPPKIMGNGKNTIKKLIDNENKLRTETKILVDIKIDNELKQQIKKQGYTLDSIPAKGVEVALRKNANLSTWGTTIDYTDQTHIQNKKLALKIAKIMDMKIIAVDFLFKDPTNPYSKKNGIVIEINDTPWIRLHHPREKEIVYNICKLLFPTLRKWKY